MTGRKKSWRSREETGQKRVVLTAETKAEGPRAAELIIGLAGLAAVIIALLGLLVLVGVLGGQRVGLLFADGQGERRGLALTVDGQLQRIACGRSLDELDQIIAAGDRFAVHGGDDVVLLQSCLGSPGRFP